MVCKECSSYLLHPARLIGLSRPSFKAVTTIIFGIVQKDTKAAEEPGGFGAAKSAGRRQSASIVDGNLTKTFLLFLHELL